MELRTRTSLTLLLALASWVSCSDDADDSAPADPSADAAVDAAGDVGGADAPEDAGGSDTTEDAGDAVTVLIEAAAGGIVDFGGGSLTIEAGALAADTTISVVELDAGALPDGASVFAAYDFGPDGTVFDPPARLRLDAVESPPEGRRAAASRLESDAWVDLPGGSHAGSLYAEVDHFTTVAGRWIAGAWRECSFTPCGGDLLGTWRVEGHCSNQEFTPPEVAWCPGVEGHVEEVLSGEGTYNEDGTWVSSYAQSAFTVTTFSAECVTASGLGTCAAINDEIYSGDAVCVGDPAIACVCTATLASDTAESGGTWTADGNSIAVTVTGGPTLTGEYCVDGDELRNSYEELGFVQVLVR